MEKARPLNNPINKSPEIDGDVLAQVTVEANRCPYCRDDVLAEQSVVCQTCLTRHHPECWDEAGRCSSCSSQTRLQLGKASLRVISEADVQRALQKEGYRREEIKAYFKPSANKYGKNCAWGECQASATAKSISGGTDLCQIHARTSRQMARLMFLAMAVIAFFITVALQIVGGQSHSLLSISFIMGFITLGFSLAALWAGASLKKFEASLKSQ